MEWQQFTKISAYKEFLILKEKVKKVQGNIAPMKR